MIENVFGIMANKWRILLRTIETSDKTADLIVKAIVVLHNFLLEYSHPARDPRRMADYGLGNEENGLWRDEIQPLPQATAAIRLRGANNYSNEARNIRKSLTKYFSDVGIVSWQDNYT